ncbi:serine hydrolase domain-containing protein [Asticcacaulis sp. AC460]|uniref:serine hydrolase domain-containing protein n=1 Tax=Asticcacaulis sp. AC460 TaxID=1282360 RepID=UPI0009DD9405|nr:serine hydrolase domain-containing protein [Asticcacaulis sp. AC460]
MAGKSFLGVGAVFALMVAAGAALAVTPEQSARIDMVVQQAMAANQTPSAQVAVVEKGKIAFSKAYGLAQIGPDVPATTASRYQIASVSKAFTAAAVMLLVDDGKLSMEDKVSKWFPELTQANDITIRQLLSHTSGYSDYWPQDYVMPSVQGQTTPRAIMDQFARAPLDYQPGEDWQYSNTGFVVAGQIVEKVSGKPLYKFIEDRIFKPAGITDGLDASAVELKAPDAVGYQRQGLGPNRLTPKAGRNWPYGSWPLALTAEDVAKWDMTLIRRSLLSPAGHDIQIQTVKLNNGKDTGYAMGWFVAKTNGRTLVSHGGEGAGYLTENRIYLEDGVAIVVLTNTMTGSAHGDIADRIAYILLPQTGVDAKVLATFEALQKGEADRSAFTDNFNDFLSERALADHRENLGAMGAPIQFTLARSSNRGGMEMRSYRLRMENGKDLRLSVYVTKEGKFEQFLMYGVN